MSQASGDAAVSNATLRRWIVAGAVLVQGRPLRRPAATVETGQRIELRLLPGALEDAVRRGVPPPALAAERLLYEDDAIIAVDKPPGLPTHPTVDPLRASLYGLVKALLESRGGPTPAYLGIHQRLDRDTSGVVLFSKAEAVNPALAAAFAGRRVSKAYLAIVARLRRLPPQEWIASGDVDGKAARTEMRLREVLPDALLVEAHPVTGRKHQVRVHLSAAGLPILGDDRYAPPAIAKRAPRLMLHAWRLSLPHPVTGREVIIESPPPADFRQAARGRSSSARSGSVPRRPS